MYVSLSRLTRAPDGKSSRIKPRMLWTAIILTRSVAIAAAGGLLIGGAAGNLLSLAFWPGVPDPIVVAPLAFNLADAFVFVGFGLVCVAVLAVASSSPLDEPVRVRR